MKIANDYLTLSVSHSAVTNAVAYDAFNVMTNMTTYRNAVGRDVPSAPQGDTNHRFVYDGYLCIQRLNAAANNAIDLAFVRRV